MALESRAGIQQCPECQQPMTLMDYCVTLVGYASERGHDHDDNCLTAFYKCPNGHTDRITHQRKCPAEGCDWLGKLTCFCHKGEKRGIWVNDRPEKRCWHRWVDQPAETPSGITYTKHVCATCGENR